MYKTVECFYILKYTIVYCYVLKRTRVYYKILSLTGRPPTPTSLVSLWSRATRRPVGDGLPCSFAVLLLAGAIYIYTYICMYKSMDACICKSLGISYISMYVLGMYVYIWFVYVHTLYVVPRKEPSFWHLCRVCMIACMYVCMQVCMRICPIVRLRASAHRYVFAYEYLYILCMYVCM